MNYKSRYYNKIEKVPNGIKKSSTNIVKISNEVEFYEALKKPQFNHLNKYFPKLIDWWIENDKMSYITEDLGEWTVSDNFTDEVLGNSLGYLLQECEQFLKDRPVKQESSAQSCHFLYLKKVKERDFMFRGSETFKKMGKAPWNYFLNKYRDLITRYLYLTENHLKFENYVAFHHGDFCLTNMFYSYNEPLKLIDPMGYDKEFKNFHDPLYDVAKLSHSILGSYDNIINNQFFIELQEDGKHSLFINGNSEQENFKAFLRRNNFDYDQVRLREASLFLSMIPLHPESLKRISALILQAENIINECEKHYGI